MSRTNSTFTKRFSIPKNEAEVYDYLDNQKNMSAYLVELVRRDMNAELSVAQNIELIYAEIRELKSSNVQIQITREQITQDEEEFDHLEDFA